MAIKKEEIKGTKILNEIESANITKSEYDTESKEMIVEFKFVVRGRIYYMYGTYDCFHRKKLRAHHVLPAC